ncbi:putative disease resistance protein RGA3 [Euphorbia lathyris]|uniref:putative disease resistance protein RGA3 n=1 Tax=Euphorbia lathyris TaxID=212925 RepID=UPI0033137D64
MAERGYVYVGKLLSNLINLIPVDFEDLKRFWGFEDQLNQLRQLLVAIADLVEGAEQKQETVVYARRWLRNLKEAAYEADNLLSELAYETTRLQIRNQEVNSFSSTSRAINDARKAKFRSQMVPKLNKVNQSLQNIQRICLSLQLSSIQHNLEDSLSQTRLPTDSIFDNSVVGRKADVAEIVNLLTSSYNEQLTVVSIVGMGGIGKTTLAKLVCQKVMALTRKPFDFTIWVCSDNFSEHKMLGEILRSLNASMQGLTNKDAILSQLKKELVSKKFLLVLDDVWNKDHSQWDLLKALLSRICRNNGNAILVTTRKEEVASVMGTSSQRIYRLNSLSNDECWFILKERAFGKVTKPVPSILEVIGRDIAKKCTGIPLIAKVLGGIMGFDRDEETWLKIRDAILLKEGDVLIAMFERILHHLPSYLKPWFAFCSTFPKGFLIRKEELIWLWMAEGIVESFDMGSKCFDALLATSVFQDEERDAYGDIILCKMHNLVHDPLLVSRSETSSIYHLYVDDQVVPYLGDTLRIGAKKLRTILVGGVPNQKIWTMERLRSLHLNVSDMEVLPSSIGKMKHLRYLDVSISKTKELPESITKLYNLQTLNLSNSSITELPEFITKLFNLQTLNLSNSSIKKLPESISKLHSLQTLNVSSSNIKELPESINKLHNLQTLDVSDSNIKELPESISELCNLQTLKFLECKELTKLPRNKINNLFSLKHIAFSYEHQMPLGLGKLSGLQTLLFFVVGRDWGGNIEELQYLNKLRGNLKITRLEEVGDKEEVERANLQQKARIQGLCFEWTYGSNDRSSRDEELLEGLQPHPNIERIKIKYYMGEKWPSWMLRMKSPGVGDSFIVINNLVDLCLERCCNCVQLPRLGDLPHLKFLKMNHMGKVKRIDNDFYGIDSEGISNECLRLFPALKSLSMRRMDNLTEWSSPSDGNRVVVFPCLEHLSIQSCSKLTGFPMSDLSELVKLEIRDCEELRLLTSRQQTFAFLTSLSIVGCSKLTYLRNWLLSDLCFMELSVKRCEWLTFIPEDFGKVSCLTSLEIYCCKRLRYFREEILCKLTRLQNLSIGAFSEELDDFCYLDGIKNLPCLEELEIWGSDFFGREMSCLPSQLQHLTVLKSLKIMGFTTMETFPEWLTNLQSLQSLSLDYCRLLGSSSTATVIQRLCNLTHLNINCCPILEESKSEWLQSLDTTRIKVEFSHVSNVRVRLGY